MKSPTLDAIQNDLATLLANFNGKEYAEPITTGTLFFADLGMASIDAVLLAEMVEQRYGQRFPFQQLLAQIATTDLQDFSVGQLAAFLHSHLATAP